MKQVVVVASLALLSGCGLPPAISIASYAIDGAVLAASGKTPSDHAISAAAEQDCSLLRAVVFEDICQDYEPTPEAATALETMPDNEEFLMTTSDGRVIRVAAETTTPEPDIQTAGNDVRLVWTAPEPGSGS